MSDGNNPRIKSRAGAASGRPSSVPTLVGREVLVYRNLTRGVWSVVDAETGLVVMHASWVRLADVLFKVSAAGRARAVRDGQRNVHAKGRGILVASGDGDGAPSPGSDGTRVRYNPFRLPYFHEADSNRRVDASDAALFAADGRLYIPSTATAVLRAT